MKNSSQKTFKELSLPYFKEVFELIDKICSQYGIQFYLIGAQARDIHLLESNIAPARGTMDIDFAIMFPDMATFNEVKTSMEKVGFEKTNQPYRMFYNKTNTVIDILPFGQIEQEGTVKFTEREVEISVVGFSEVNDSVEEIEIEGVSLKVAPLAGIFLLKLISWNERPVERAKDFDDIKFIMQHYFTLYQNRFYQDHLDCLDEIPTDNFQLLAGARLLGRDMSSIINRSGSLKIIITEIIDTRLKANLNNFGNNSSTNGDLDQQLLEHIQKGIEE